MVKAYIDSLRNDKAKRTRFALMVAIIAIVLFAAVFWTLRFIGITMTDEAGCGLLEHTHTEECYERVLICDIPEGEEHTHTDECYELRLICDKEEHTHTALCYPDTSADVESPEDWEATLPAQEVMTGEWARDIIAVAQSQVGYKESERNYSLEEDGTHNGYTRFGAWYGSPYAPWNAMFVSFCLNYSNVPASVLAPNAGVEAFVAGVNSNYIDKTSGEPLPGDIILLDTDGDGSADKLGVIADVYDDRGADLITTSTGSGAEEAPARRTVRFVMGDMDGAVGETVMTVDNNWILGYVHTSVLNSDYIDNTPVPSEEPEETDEPEETAEPGDVRETEAPEPTQVPRDYQRGISDSTGTNTNTVIAHVDWGNLANYSSQVVTVTLYRNGVATGNTLTLNAANNWTGAFTGLSTGYNYSIEYSEPSGYAMIVSAATEATQSWQRVTSTSTTALPTSGVYAFIDKSTVNGSTVYRAIGSQTPDNNGEYLEYYSIAHNSGTPIFVPTIAQWSPVSSSLSTGGSGTSSSPYYGSAYWENMASGSYLYKFQDSNSPTGHSFGENNSNDSHHSIKVNFTASAYSGYISYTNSTATYYLSYGALTSGNVYDFLATTTYSDRSIIGLYRKSTGSGYTTDYTISMSEINEYPANDPQITHNKTIDWLGDGDGNSDTTLDNTNPTENNKDDYRLYLDVLGKSNPVDLIIVIDKSNSMGGTSGTDMYDSNNNSITRIKAVMNFLNGEGYSSGGTSTGFIRDFLDANAYNQLAIVTFSDGESTDHTYTYQNDATIVRNFGRNYSNVIINLATNTSEAGATNYCAGLYQVDDLLSQASYANNGHQKIVVFMSDGEPTVSLTGKTATSPTGNGTETTDEIGAETFATIYEITGKYPDVVFDSVAFHGPNTTFVTDYLSSIATNGHGGLYDANSSSALTLAINKTIFPYGAEIKDTLSDYVDYNTTQPDLIVTRSTNGGIPVVIWRNGAAVSGYTNIIDSCSYDASTKTVTLKFKDDYLLNATDVFTVSFNVKINQYAKDQFTQNQGYSGMVGDYGTDYPGNNTSSLKPGFFSNSDAKLSYKLGSKNILENYVRPVVQTEPNTEPSGGQGEAVFDHSKTIDWLGDGDPNPDTGASGDNMYRLYLDWSGEFSQPYDLMLVIDKSASMLYAPDGSTATSSNPSRETLVENLLNGTDGLINTFLNANENNRISIVTFGGEPEERMTVSSWSQISSLTEGTIITIKDSRGYLGFTSSSDYLTYYSSNSSAYTHWAVRTPSEGSGYMLKNIGAGVYLSESSSSPYYLIKGTSTTGYIFTKSGNYLTDSSGYYLYYYNGNHEYACYSDSTSYRTALTFYQANTSYTYDIDTTVARNWGRNGSNVELNVIDNTGTNYEAGLMKAEELWNSSTNPNRIMIFLSDGMPTYWVNNNGTRGGTGLETTDNLASAKTESISAANYFKNNYGVGTSYNVTSYSVLFNSQSGVDTGALAAIATSNTAMTASDASSLINTLNSFIYPSNVKIVDTLSKYVSYNPATGALKVTRVNKNTGAIQVLYENGSVTATGQGIIQSVVYTPGDTSLEPTASTGTITVNFVDGFVVDPTYDYTVSFNVTTTKTAENEKAYNIEHNVEGDPTGYAGVTGDVGTDFTYTGTQGDVTYNNHNTTSSTMPGFHSNDEAYVSLTLGGEDITDYYDHPVVQVEASSGSETTVENFDKTKVIDWLGDGEENPDTDFSGEDDYRLYLDWSGEFSTPYDLLVIVDVSASMLDGVDGTSDPAAGQSREEIVESILNGQNGIINRFLGANWNTTTNKSNNSAAVIKFGGEPDPRLPAASWNTVTTLTNKTAVMLYTDSYALADMGSGSQNYGSISRVAPDPTDQRQWWSVGVPTSGNGFYFTNVATGRNILHDSSNYNVYLTNTNSVTPFALSNGKLKFYSSNYYLAYSSSYTYGFKMVSSGGDTFEIKQKTNVQYSYLYDAEVVHSWSNTDFDVDLNVRNDTGTNYAAGLRLAREVLQTSPHQNKIVIFLSDGEPTYWLISDTERGGTGLSSNATNVANAKTASINAANSFKAAFPNVPMYGVMFNTNSTVIENAREVLQAISTSGQAYVAESGAQLLEYFNMMTSPSNMVVTDYLSQYVEFNPALGGDKMVTRVNKNTGEIVVLYEESEGGIQAAGQDVIKPGYPKYTPWNEMTADEKTAHPDAVCNGKIELQFVDGFVIDPDYRYTLSFNVHVSDEAKAAKQAKVAVYDAWVKTDPTFTVGGNTYHLFDQDGQLILDNYELLTDETNPTKAYVDSMLNLYCPEGITDTGDYIGDPGTDYSYNAQGISNNNHTSSGMPGFRSNHDATVSYTFGHDVVEHYDHPVVQVTVEGEEKPDTNFHNNKVIDWLGDGIANPDTDVDDNLSGEALEDIYRLYLDMSGKQNKGCDLMIIIDRSNSMNESAGNGMTRIDAVNRVLFGPNDNDGLLAEFLSANDGKNRICMIGFGGQRTNGHQNDANYDYSLDSNLIRGWGRDASVPQSGYITAPTDFGTDYSAALLLAGEAWEQVYTDDTNKLMIFLSDGEPSFWIDVSNGVNTTNHTAGRRYGNGTQSSINAETAAGAKATYDWFHAAFPAVHTESVGFGTSFDTNVLNYYAKNGDPNSSAVALRATDYEGLLAALKAQIYPSSIVISDALSKYVRYYSADADLKVTMKREIGTDSETGDPIYEEATIYENGHIVNNAPVYVGGVATDDTVDGRDYIRRVSYTEGDTSAVPTSSTGTVEVEFDPEFVADPSYVFTVSFNITVTQAAYLAQNNGVAHNVGDEGTDYPGNTSSSNKMGYWSNDEASRVTYNIGSETQNDPYDKPVIQAPDQPVEEETSTGAKATVTKSWDDENDKYMLRPESIIVRLYANGQPTGKYAILSADNGWTYTWNDLPAYDDNGDLIEYSIEEDDVYAYTPVYADPTYSTTGDRQFYVRYYPNEGTGQLYNDGPYSAASANDPITATVKPNVNSDFSFTRAGYNFTGWNTQPDGSGTSYAPGATITLNDHVKLYAQWQQNAVATYTLTYNKNGSDVTGIVPTGGTYESGDTVTVAGKGTLARDGYTFTGWNTAANGSGTSYAPGNTFTINANTTLYAQWEAVAAGVWYPVDEIVPGQEYLIGFVVDGNVYLAVNYNEDASNHYYNNVSYTYYGYTALATMSGNNVIGVTGNADDLQYCTWKFSTTSGGTVTSGYESGRYLYGYTSTYYSDLYPNTSSQTWTYSNHSLNNGYAYASYYELSGNNYMQIVSSTGTNTYVQLYSQTQGGTQPTDQPTATPTAAPTATPTPTPTPTPSGYTVTFNANGGTLTGASSATNVASGTQFGSVNGFNSEPTHSTSGYYFLGWFTADTDGTEVTSTQTVTGNITLYAHYYKWTYYRDNSGTFVDGDLYCFDHTYSNTTYTVTNSTNGNDLTAGDSSSVATNQAWKAVAASDGFYYFQSQSNTSYYMGYVDSYLTYVASTNTSNNRFSFKAESTGSNSFYLLCNNGNYMYYNGTYYRVNSTSNKTAFTVYHRMKQDMNVTSSSILPDPVTGDFRNDPDDLIKVNEPTAPVTIIEPTEPEIVPTRTVIVETVVAGAEAAGVDVESLNITSNVTETGNETTHSRPVVVESVISGAEAAGVDVSNIDAIEEAPAENAAEPAENTPSRSAIVETVVSGAEAAGVDVPDIIEPQKTPEPKAAENDPEPEPERVPDVTVTYTLVDHFERGGAYIIVANSSINDRTGYAVGNFAVSRGHYLAPVAVTVNDNGTLTVSSSVAANILWNASGTRSTGFTLHNAAVGRYMGLDENEFLAPVSVAYLWHYTSDGRLDKGADSEGYRFLSFVTGDTAKFTTSMGKAGGDLSFRLYKLEGELEINVPEPVDDSKKDETPVVVEAVIAGAEAAGVDIDAMLNASSAHAQEAGVPDNTETTEATEAEPDTAVVVEAVIAGAEAAGVDIGDYDYTAYASTEAPVVTPEPNTDDPEVPEVTPEPKVEDDKPEDHNEDTPAATPVPRGDGAIVKAGEVWVPATTLTTGTDYLIGITHSTGDTFLLMNYNPSTTNNYYYSYNSNYLGYAVKAIMDGSNVTGVDTSYYSGAAMDYVKWNLVANSSYYRIRSSYQNSYYLRVESGSYEGCYPNTEYSTYGNNWTWDSSTKYLYHNASGTVKYVEFYYNSNAGIGWFGADTDSQYAREVTFYVKQTAQNYTVTYNSNGATSGSVPTDSNSPYASGATVTVLGNTGNLAKTGYSFIGWNTQANGNGTSYAQGATFTINANTTLYAQWTPITYTVSFDANGGTLTGSPSTTYAYGATYGSDTAFTSAPTRSGYTFAGWYTSATGGTQVNGSSTVTSGGVLYAHWTENAPTTYTVTFDPNGGTLTGASTATYNAGSAYNTDTAFTSAPTRSGYTFAGWYTQMNGGTQVNGSSTVTGSTMLYAHWTQNSGSGEYIYQLVDHFEENGEYVIVINGYAVVGSVYDTSNNKYLSRQAVTENVDIVSIPSSVDPNTVLWRANAVTTGGASGWSLLNLAANKYMAFKGTSTSSDEVITLMTTNNIPWAYDSTNLDLNDQIDSEGYYYLKLNTNYFTTSKNASQGVKLYRRIQQQETTDYTIHWHLGITNKLDRKPLELEKHIAGPTGPMLDGATFIIARCDDNWNIYDSASGHDLMLTATSTDGGQIIFTDPRLDGDGIAYGLNCLPYGKYVINETNTPEGYQGAGPWHVIVDENGARVVDDNGWEIETGTGGNYALINQPVYELPETGGAGVYAYTAVGAMLMLVPAAYLVIDRRKRKHSSN